jgi:hypothetical protein
MNNQHAGLSQTLAEQHVTGLREHATCQRPKLAARHPRRRRTSLPRRWWQLLDRQPSSRTSDPVARTALVDRSEATMSKRTRALILGATLAAMNLVGLTAVAHAQANDDPDGKEARRLVTTERQAGEIRRERPLTAQQQTAADASLQQQLARERFSIPSGLPAQVPAPAPAEPSGRPGWLLASLGVLAAGLALAGGLAVLAAKRAGRRARIGHAA